MTKDEFVGLVAEKCSFKKSDIKVVLDAVLETITDELSSGRSVRFIGFGTFEYREVRARKASNPQTKEVIELAPTGRFAFKPGAALKEAAVAHYALVHAPAPKKRGRAKKTNM